MGNFFAVQKMKGFPQNNLADGKNLLNRTGRETNIKYVPSKQREIYKVTIVSAVIHIKQGKENIKIKYKRVQKL